MQYLAEPTAATLKGCGYALQPKPRETKQTRFFFSENVWSEAHVCFCVVLPQFSLFFV
jgi:hypothetical protein